MSEEPRVWIAQMLCPHRHMIAALAGVCSDEADARLKLGGALTAQLDLMLGVNPWCGICGAERLSWHIEFGRSRWRTMAEAEEPLRENEQQQLLTKLILGSDGTKPGRA